MCVFLNKIFKTKHKPVNKTKVLRLCIFLCMSGTQINVQIFCCSMYTVQPVKCIFCLYVNINVCVCVLVISPSPEQKKGSKDFCEFHNIEQIKTEEKWGFIDEEKKTVQLYFCTQILMVKWMPGYYFVIRISTLNVITLCLKIAQRKLKLKLCFC